MNFDPSNSPNKKPFVPAPTGTHFARCIAIIDIGTQTDSYGTKRKMNVTFELIGSVMPKENAADPDRPFTFTKEYTMSFGTTATWYKHVAGWINRPINPGEVISSKELLGKECMINIADVMKKDRSGMRRDLVSISPLPGGQQIPPAKNPIMEFEIGSPNQFQVFPQVHSWMRDKICKSPEFQNECFKTGQNADQLNNAAKEAWKAANPLPNQQGGQQQYQQPAMQPNQQWMQQGQQQQPWQNQQQPYQQPAQQYQQGPPPGYQQPAQYPNPSQPYQQPTQPAQTGFGQQQPAQTGFGQQQQNQQRNMNPQQQGFGQQQPAPAFGQQPIYTGNQNDVNPLD